ncbi:MAG: gamma-glutamyl-gamma-aminobutyrate hydrolase family protein [Paracoccaceae bacterium]
MGKPKIAILMDENTSGDASRYEATKTYFQAIDNAGGVGFGVPYLNSSIAPVVAEFDGLMTCGGRFAYPPNWYIGDQTAQTPHSARFEVEKAIVSGFLERDKPILGICAGMQMLACLQGCKLTPDLAVTFPNAQEHDLVDHLHDITITPGSKLADILGAITLPVNSRHREAIAALNAPVIASAHANDGIIEAIELPGFTFAIGLQWHQEKFVGTDHLGNRLFAGLVNAA